MGCVNCKKTGTQAAQSTTTGKTPSGNVIWDGTAYTCASNPALDTQISDNLNTILLRLLDAACNNSGGCCIETTTHTALTALITAGTLNPNTIYRFPYATKHLIAGTTAVYNDTTAHYDPGTAVKASFVPETEYLWVRALTATEVHVEAYSEAHPRDIIYYDVADVLTEDGLQARPGFITYREDPDKDVSTHFDFRNVLHRRWDMDQDIAVQNRDADFELALGNDPASAWNHDVTYSGGGAGTWGSIPAFTNFDNGGNADLGMVVTPNNSGFRDFKTFVGYDEILYKTPSAEAPRYRNVHIKKSDAVAKVIGSASGASVSLTNAGTIGGAYPFFANVVFFGRSVENVSIGENATGITVVGRAIRELKIGHNNENIIIGGIQSAPFYTVPTEPEQYGYNENITIGDNNRNIMISDANRRINIGNSNIGIFFNKFGYNNEIGSYNTDVYLSFSNECIVENWCKTVRISGSQNVEVGSQGFTIDVVRCQSGQPISGFTRTGIAKNIPDGFNNVLADTENSNTKIEIGAACKDLFFVGCFGVKVGSQNQKGLMYAAAGLEMGANNYKFDIQTSFHLTVGNVNQDFEVSDSTSSSIANQCSSIKILNAGYVDIDNGSSYSMISNGSSSVSLGKFCSYVVASFAQRCNLGTGVSNATLRTPSDLTIGNQSTDLYFEGSSGSVGSGCSNIVMNTIGLTAKPTFHNDFTLYNYSVGDSRIANSSGRTYVAAGSPILATEYLTSLSEYINSPAYVANAWFTQDNNVGNNCSNINITASKENTIGDNCSGIYIGCDALTTLDYPLTFTAGVADPAGSTPAYTVPNITGLANVEGYNCDGNVIGSNVDDVKLRGISQINNEFGSHCGDVEAVPGFAFGNNKVLVPGASVTCAAIQIGHSFQLADASNGRWSHVVDATTGAYSSSNKLA